MLTNINVDVDEFSIFQRFLVSLFAFVFSHCPQIAEASLRRQCLYKTK